MSLPLFDPMLFPCPAPVDFADRYGVPDHLKKFPLYHVRVKWQDSQGKDLAVGGPVCFGGGR